MANGSSDLNPLNALIRGFLDHRVAPNLIAIIMSIAGLVALTRMNTQFFPTTEIPTISVSIVWPGASAEEISEGILDIVEPEIRFIDNIDKVISYAVEGIVRVTLEFEEGTDMNKALSDVESRIATIITLPQDSERPIITRIQLYETVGLVAVSGPFDEAAIQDTAKELRDTLLDAGIDRVTLGGKRDREIWVEIPSAAMQQLNLSARDVADRIAVVSQNLPLGNLEGDTEKQLRARGRTDTADGVATIELKAFESGQKILMRDVAVVREAYEENAIRQFRDGEKAIILNVQRAISGDTLRSMRTMLDTVEAFKARAPPTMKIEAFDIRAKIVDQRISMLSSNALQGFALVVLVLLVFLNARVAFWVALGVPVALLATFAFMLATGQTINAVSLVALILVLGIIVDDAIVVGEEAVTRSDRGASPKDAAGEAAMRMAMPVIASTATTQAAFLPMLLITGVIGQILGAIPMVVIVALMASLIECFFTLPSHLMHSLESSKRRIGRGKTWLGRIGAAGRRGCDEALNRFRYGPVARLVDLAYHWRYVTVAISVAGMIAAVGLISGGRVAFTFFPAPEPEVVFANVTFAPGLPEPKRIEALARVEAAAREAERTLLSRQKAEAGEEPKASDERLILMSYTTLGQQGQSRGENLAIIEVELTPGEERAVRTAKFINAWQKALPDIAGIDGVAILGRRIGPPGFDIDVRLTGARLDQLKRASLDLRETLSGYGGLVGLNDDLPFGKVEVILQLTPRGQALGFTTQSVASQVRAAYQGAIAVRFARGDEEVTIRVRASEDDRKRGLQGLSSLNLRSPSGRNVNLSEVVSFVEQQAFSVIQRFDGKLAVSVVANVDSDVTTADEVLEALRAGPLPALEAKYGITSTFEGRAETQRRTFADLRIGALLALVLIYCILVFVFQRWLQPLLVMAIIPFGFIGMVVGHYAMGFNLALFSLVGLLGLSGITVNGAIVMIDRMNERLANGEPIDQAARGAAVDRVRALLLTTLTTIGGMAPLLFEESLQAQFLIPIAITLSWGLGFSTILLLFLLPALVGIGVDVRRGTSWLWQLLMPRPAPGT
jgi:multidrug efflux pump subunit AcrB